MPTALAALVVVVVSTGSISDLAGHSRTPVTTPDRPANGGAAASTGTQAGGAGPPGSSRGQAGPYPAAGNTGVPAGLALTPNAGLSVTKAGTVIDRQDISGPVLIGADNVVLKQSRVRNGSFDTVRIADGVTGVVIEDTEIDGLSRTAGNTGVRGVATVLRSDIHGVENGVVLGDDSVLRDSYVHDLVSPGAPHYDGVELDGGQSNVVIEHNTIRNNNDQTAAIMIDNYFGPVSNIKVDNNVLSGGTYTIYSDASFTGGPIVGVSITNNRFGEHQYGYSLVRDNTLAGFSGNLEDPTGKLIEP